MANRSTEARAAHDGIPISRLQGDAWAAWNASYHAPMPDMYRTLSLSLYKQALHQRIQTLFVRLDEQNAQLDALLLSHIGAGGVEGERRPCYTDFCDSGQVDGSTRSDSVRGRAA